MARYSIMVRENRPNAREYLLAACDSNPEAIVAAAQQKTQMVYVGNGSRRSRMPVYAHVYAIDHEAPQKSVKVRARTK